MADTRDGTPRPQTSPHVAEDGYEALRTRAGLVTSRPGDWICASGEDRLRFVNGLVSCDLRSLPAEEGTYGFLTDPKGRVIADAAFLETRSGLFAEVPQGRGPGIAGHMRKYVVADRVVIETLEDWRTIYVAGPEASARLADVFGRVETLEPWSGTIRDGAGASRILVRADRRLGVPAWALAGSREALNEVARALAAAGVEPASDAAVAAVRIESGVPWYGLEFGPDSGDGGSFPQETGIESWAVSFEKGCYLGQEVIARIHFRGKVNRSLRGLMFEPEARPPAGLSLLWNGEAVGVMNSVAHSPALGHPVGLAIVHHKAEVGGVLSTAAGSCRLVELPFDLETA